MKQKILPKLVVFTLSIILFSGCNKWLENEFHPLPENLYPVYAEGDTFFYKSIVTEDIDTFLVTDFVLDTIFNGSILFERSAAIFGEIVADTVGSEFFYISNEPEKAIFWWDSAYVTLQSTSVPLDTTIQGYDYTNLMVAVALRLDTTTERLHKIYFDWDYGLVKFERNNFDVYELFSRPE